jgi:hypothetical protein
MNEMLNKCQHQVSSKQNFQVADNNSLCLQNYENEVWERIFVQGKGIIHAGYSSQSWNQR